MLTLFIIGLILVVGVISLIIWNKVKSEFSQIDKLIPPEGFKKISIRKLPTEWTELEKKSIIIIENFILFGEGVNKYKSFREHYFSLHPNGLPYDVCWSFFQHLMLEYGNNEYITSEIKEVMEQFRYEEKEEKRRSKLGRKRKEIE